MLRSLPTPLRFLAAALIGLLCAVGFSAIVFGAMFLFRLAPQAS